MEVNLLFFEEQFKARGGFIVNHVQRGFKTGCVQLILNLLIGLKKTVACSVLEWVGKNGVSYVRIRHH